MHAYIVSQSVRSQDAYQLLIEDYKHHPCDEHRNSQLLQEKIAIASRLNGNYNFACFKILLLKYYCGHW